MIGRLFKKCVSQSNLYSIFSDTLAYRVFLLPKHLFDCFLFDLVGSYNPDYGDTEGVQIIGKVEVYAMGFVLF